MSTAVSIPFHINSTGSVQTTSSDDQALQDRVMALVSTVPGERLMRSDYGVPTPNFLFEPNIRDSLFGQLQGAAMQAIRRWEPTAVIVGVTPIANQDNTTVAFDVRVGRADTPSNERPRLKTVYVAVGGDILETGN